MFTTIITAGFAAEWTTGDPWTDYCHNCETKIPGDMVVATVTITEDWKASKKFHAGDCWETFEAEVAEHATDANDFHLV